MSGGIHAVNTGQRLVAVLIAVDVDQRHLIPDLLSQPEPLPHKTGDHLPAVRLPCQRPAAGLADAPAERIVAEADRHLRPGAVARPAGDLRQAVLTVVAVKQLLEDAENTTAIYSGIVLFILTQDISL